MGRRKSRIVNGFRVSREKVTENGLGYVVYKNGAEYNIIIGVAYHGKTKNITDLLKERRQEIVSMF